MEKINSKRFVVRVLIVAIFVFLPFFNISDTYAADKTPGISGEGEAYRIKGYEAQQRGDIDTAIEWYQKAASIKPEYASPHNDLGILFETKGWLDRAESEYEKALIINPNYKEVHTNLALLYERKGELEKAAFHWMRRYKLGRPNDPWTQEARSRLEKLGLLEKTEEELSPKKIEQKAPAVKEPQKKESAVKKSIKKPAEKKVTAKSKAKAKKGSDWTRLGSEKKKEPVEISEPGNNMDKELQESLRMAEERLKKERNIKETAKKEEASDAVANSEAGIAYNRAKDYYNKGEYSKALDEIRTIKEDRAEDKRLSELEEDIKFKMKEKKIEDHYKEGMIQFRQKDFTGARKEFEAILSILPE